MMFRKRKDGPGWVDTATLLGNISTRASEFMHGPKGFPEDTILVAMFPPEAVYGSDDEWLGGWHLSVIRQAEAIHEDPSARLFAGMTLIELISSNPGGTVVVCSNMTTDDAQWVATMALRGVDFGHLVQVFKVIDEAWCCMSDPCVCDVSAGEVVYR